MFKKRLITISALPFVMALLLGSSLIISNKPEKVSAINDTHEHDGWTGVDQLPTVADNYNIYLTDNITLTETWTVPEGITNLCLNGHVINANDENYSVITIPTGATLNLYDCGTTEHNGYVDSTGLWHYDSTGIHELLEDETAKTITGGIITGGNTTYGGGVNVSGTFNMYGGNIAGNTAQNGGGISNTSSFTMTDGNIVGNTATINGGGVYVSSLILLNILAGGTITDNTAPNGGGGGVYYQGVMCFAPGTLITMADGTRQAIETLNIGDSVRVFDHEKGEISSSRIFDVWTYPEKHSGVVKLYFSNDIDVTVVYGHSFFEHEQNKYVAVTRDNVSAFVGHEFYNADNERWETLKGYEFIDGEVDTYVITTEYQLNCVANGMLSNEDGFYSLLTNIFDYGDNLKIDQVKKEQDIANFGLYGYENTKHISKHVYDILNIQYLKVAFGKHLITENEFNYLEAYYAEVDPELYCNGKEETPVESKSGLLKAPLKAPLLSSSVFAPDPGFYVGGSTKMLGNKGGNLYLSSEKTITIGTGTGEGGNGVVAPTEDMNIGLTLADGTGKITINGTANYSSNFFSDKLEYGVKYNSETLGSEYLELVDAYAITNNTKEADKATNNGYIEVKETAIEDEEVLVAVYPNQGYKLSSLVYNDGTQDHDIDTSTKSFTMPGGAVSVTANFEEKGEQVVTIVLDEKFIYPNTPNITEKHTYSISNYYEKLGDGVATVEYKPKGADDSEYTTEVPTEYGEYTLRVSVAEGSEYKAGFATKDFIYSPQIITQVGFGNLKQPVAGAVVPEKTGGMLVNTKYSETLTWDPEISTVNEDGKKIFDCNTTYTATVTLTIKDKFADDYVFAEAPTLKGAGSGWVLSEDSTDKMLIYTKEFEPTADHSFINKINGTNATCTKDGFKDAYQCETCSLYYEDEACSKLIGDETAYNAWILGDGKISALGHKMTYHEAVAPTCTEDGNVEYWTCSHESGVYYADEQGTSTLTSIVVSKLGHDIIHHDAKTPTCTEVGWEEYDTCSRCDYSTYVEIPTLEHSLSEVTGKLPTCTEDGYMVAYKCSTCEMYFTDPAGEHEIGNETAYNAWKLNEGKIQARHVVSKVSGVDPTKERSGYKEAYKCSECNKYFEDEACTKVIGDESAYNTWKTTNGYLPQLPSSGLSAGAIAGIVLGSFLFVLIVIYLVGYFFLYRKGKIDEKKIKVIYKFLPRGEKNLKEDDK